MDICDRIRRARRAGKTHCGIVNGRLAVSEAARAFGLADDSAIFRSIDKAEADAIAIRILHTDLAYGTKIMALARAARGVANGEDLVCGRHAAAPGGG